MLALLVVQAGMLGAELLFATVGIVVLVSVTVHEATSSPISVWCERRVAKKAHA